MKNKGYTISMILVLIVHVFVLCVYFIADKPDLAMGMALGLILGRQLTHISRSLILKDKRDALDTMDKDL